MATTYTKELLREKITTDQRWTERAIVALFKAQTPDEQYLGETKENNGVGFNGTDAEFLSSLAGWILQGRSLTPKQLVIAQRKVAKYAGQLARLAYAKSPTN